MKKSYRSIYICGLLFLFLFSIAGCNLSNIKAEKESVNSNTVQAEGDRSEEKPPQNSSYAAGPQITSASVAGIYEYDTYKDGEGYDNELEIKDAGNGKLYVFLSGSYIYRVGETQSFHDAEGKGDAVLRGNRADARLLDEEGKPCRATIIFGKNQATVKISDACRFNIALDGVYKRARAAKSADKKTNDAAKAREITFVELYEVVNDFVKYKAGERFVITDVPASKIATVSRADQFGNESYKNLFYLEAGDDEGNVANGFLTSKLMVKNLENNAEHKSAKLRVTAVLIESRGKFDVYRMAFVTEVEGIGGEGEVVWTAIGDEPTKIKFQH